LLSIDALAGVKEQACSWFSWCLFFVLFEACPELSRRGQAKERKMLIRIKKYLIVN
jgi:hypothetical protein